MKSMTLVAYFWFVLVFGLSVGSSSSSWFGNRRLHSRCVRLFCDFASFGSKDLLELAPAVFCSV